MNAAKSLADIRGYAAAGRVEFTSHALEEMANANASALDVLSGLSKARSCTYQPLHGRWKVRGPDRVGDEMTVIVFIEDGLLVVTVW